MKNEFRASKKELIDALSEMREEYFSVLFRECQLKDKFGHLWNIQYVRFDCNWTIITLGLDGGENYSCAMIAADGHLNELLDYEFVNKSENGTFSSR